MQIVYRRRWAALEGGDMRLAMERNIYAVMLQWSISRILLRENNNLAGGRKDFLSSEEEGGAEPQ